ncbi:unnamed protein product [Anisakis simplex]|uniref:Uncharacterized protein n=1 Tax=Anisakis simplex TaxID=6269 RepID=A0A3P6Q849_ANISI|nr:unnamed protein product [Anisakis simplex]
MRRTQYCWGVHENPESMDVVEKLYRWFVDNSRYFHRDTENLLEAQACTTHATQLKEYYSLNDGYRLIDFGERSTKLFISQLTTYDFSLIHKTVMGELPTGMLTYLGNRDETKRVMWDYFKTNWTLVSFGVPPFQDYMEAAMTFWNTQEDLNLVSAH